MRKQLEEQIRAVLTSAAGSDVAFWLLASVLVLVKLALTSDLPLQIILTPTDDSMYVEQAFHLLSGEAFGPYDSTILVKYPGISLWLAAVRTLGIPFLLSVDAVYLGAGIYLATGLLSCGANRWLVLLSFALYVFNPITLGTEWIRVMREPLATGLLVAMIGAMSHMLAARQEGRFPWGHFAVFAVLFPFALYVREDDRLLWALLGLFFIALITQVFSFKLRNWRAIAFAATAIIIPAGLAKAYEHGLRVFIEDHYGLPILHDFSEGEFPRLLAAIRGIHTAKDNRMVMVTQEAIQKLRSEVPAFRPVAERLPRPGPGTYSCRLQGVCSEWSNGWMPFWVKDEAFRAGLTPSLPAAQAYYKNVRIGIEQACAQRRLQCSYKGHGLIPPMELRWTKAYVVEAWRLAKWALMPAITRVSGVPVVYNVPLDLGRIYQAVTMTSYFDTQLQAGFGVSPATRQYENPIAPWRDELFAPIRVVGALLIIAAFAALVIRLGIADRAALTPLALVAVIFGLYAVFRLAVLSYVAVYMGQFAPRIVYSTYALSIMLALPFLEETIRALRSIRGREPALK